MTPQQEKLMSIGSEMSNVLRNLGQHKRREITEREGELFYALAKKWDEARRAPAPTEPAVDRDGWVATKEGLPLPKSYARMLYEGWKAQSGIESTFEEFVGKYGYFLSLDSIGACWQHARGNFAIRAALATPASPAVPVADCGPNPVTWQPADVARLDAALHKMFGTPAVPSPAPLAPNFADLVQVDRKRVYIRGGVQQFLMAYEPENDDEAKWYAGQLRKFLTAQAAQSTSTPAAAMHRLICQLASLKSSTPEAVNLLVEEAKRVMGKN